LLRYDDGETKYDLFEHDEPKGSAWVYNVHCTYNGEACAPDDPRLLALIAQVAPVEVRPATPTPHPESFPHSPPSNRPVRRPMRRLVLSPQALATATATEVHPHTPHAGRSGRATQANNSLNASHDHAVTLSLASSTPVRSRGRTGGTITCPLLHPGNRRLMHTRSRRGGFIGMACPARRRTERCHARGLHVPMHTLHVASPPPCCELPLHSHPVTCACCPARRFAWVSRCAPDAPIAAVFPPEP
jgi:hypothetical protein